ncbi:MAG: hypothetical protein IKS28_05010, partial [Clostridia bacterium]|nr:hypothetical protein [Clostridia bacterium]
MLSDEVQQARTMMPVTNSGLSALLDEAMSKYYTMNKKLMSLQIYDEIPENLNPDIFEEMKFTKEDADEITRFLNNITFSLS